MAGAHAHRRRVQADEEEAAARRWKVGQRLDVPAADAERDAVRTGPGAFQQRAQVDDLRRLLATTGHARESCGRPARARFAATSPIRAPTLATATRIPSTEDQALGRRRLAGPSADRLGSATVADLLG